MNTPLFPLIEELGLPDRDGVLSVSTSNVSLGTSRAELLTRRVYELIFTHSCGARTQMLERSEKKRVIVCECQMPAIEIPAGVRTFEDFRTMMLERLSSGKKYVPIE